MTGYSPRPGVSGWVHDEGDAFVQINADGFRDRDHSHEKPAGTVRIAVLGDSFTEARQVDVSETFWSVTERKLADCRGLAGRQAEVLNFGVSGYGTVQEYLLLEHVWLFHPDVVLVAFFAGNDILNNSFELERNTQKPYMLEQSGSLVADFSFRDTAFFRRQTSLPARFLLSVTDNSRVAQLIAESVRVFRHHRAVRRAMSAATGTGAVPRELGLDPEIYRPPVIKSHIEAWRVTERLLSAMGEQARMHGARFAVITIPHHGQTRPDRSKRVAEERALGVRDLFYAEDRITALGAREGFPVFAIGRSMQREAEKTGAFLNGFVKTELGAGHWNAEGHRIAGALIADELCEYLKVR